MRHRIDAGFSFFFHPDAPRFYRLAQLMMNRRNRDCVTDDLSSSGAPEALYLILYHTKPNVA